MSESMTEKSRKQRVFWNPDERRRVIHAAVQVYLEDDTSLWRHMNEAQRRVLTQERQRLITSSLIATDEDKAMFRVAREKFLAQKYQVVPAPAPAVEPELTPTPVSKPEPQDVEQIAQEPVLDRATIIGGITNEELFDLLARRLAPILNGFGVLLNMLKTQLFSPVTSSAPAKEASAPSPAPVAVPPAPQVTQFVATSPPPVAQVATHPTPPPAPPAPPPEPKMTKVLIFNFPPEIVDEVKRKSKNFNLELLFATQVQGEGPPKIPGCDWCIVNDRVAQTRRAKTALHARPGKDHLFYFGSADTVLRKLNEINSRKK